MAARLNKRHQDFVREGWRFYVYEVLDIDGFVIYVGKGSGGRARTSLKERGGVDVREVARFRRERDAYAFEIKHIAACAPALNRHAGGNGPRSKPAPRVPLWVREIESIGTRVYAARLLLQYGLAGSKVDQIRRVAYG